MKILLDIDNVVANWTGRAIETMGLSLADPVLRDKVESKEMLDDSILDVDELWKRIGIERHLWWYKLQPFPWARRLWHICNKIAPTDFLSTPWYKHGADIMASASAGKVMWIMEHFGTDHFFLGVHKERLAGPGVLLIDDNSENCKKFTDAGGFAFHFPNPLKVQREGTWNRVMLNLLGYIDLVVIPDGPTESRDQVKALQGRLRELAGVQVSPKKVTI